VISRSLAALLGAALLVGACSSDPEPKADKPTESATSTSPTPTPTPTPTSLLAGRVGLLDGPVLAVKIDNTAKAHPQRGLTKADVVYIEQVEGGVTRLVAIFSSQLPQKVAPVRSARHTDVDLLRQYGTVALAYSGSNRGVGRALHKAPIKLVSNDVSHRGYARTSSRPAPYNVVGDPAELLKRAGKGVDVPKRVGYEFGELPAGGKPAKSVTARYPMATVGAVWSEKRTEWLMSMDGRKSMAEEGGQLGASTFVIQYATVKGSRFHDVNGVTSPETDTIGHGRALIFRNGQMFKGLWSRKKATAPTIYTIGGETAVFAPGTLWVALIGRGRPVSVR
jgi:hypothetical protein